jgi:hypothetical protein
MNVSTPKHYKWLQELGFQKIYTFALFQGTSQLGLVFAVSLVGSLVPMLTTFYTQQQK